MAKLTPVQQAVIDLLKDGWEIGKSGGLYPHAWIQKGGAGRGGESKPLRITTFLTLEKLGLIVCTEHKYPTFKYNLKPEEVAK